MVTSSKSVCWDCRRVSQGSSTCPECRLPMVPMGTKWRPPRRSQDHKWSQQFDRWAAGLAHNGRNYRAEERERRADLATKAHIATKMRKRMARRPMWRKHDQG